jgi:hypothetical protein
MATEPDTASTRGRSNRNRGARAEVQVVNWLRDHGYPDARRYLAGDGRQPGDLDFHPLLVVEVKDCAASAWPTWCRQAAAAAPPGTVPVVVRRTRGNPDVGMWECRWPQREIVTLDDDYVWHFDEVLSVPNATTWSPNGLVHKVATFADLIAAVRQLDEVDR